jgi:hypothetical protein
MRKLIENYVLTLFSINNKYDEKFKKLLDDILPNMKINKQLNNEYNWDILNENTN